MSYILDALKRADAERQRGQVPGLHAQQASAPALAAAPGAKNRLWLGVGAALVLGAVAAGLWAWHSPERDARLAAADPALQRPAVPALREPVATPAPATPAAPEPGASSAPPPAMAPAAVTPAPRPASPAPAVKTQPPKPKVAPAPKAATPGASAPPTQKPLALAKAPPATPGSVPLLSELPPDIRRQIPAIAINGVVYSDTPGRRLLLVNQQVLSQGSQAVPEVSLEEIGPHNSVFSFRGTRFRLAH